MKQTEFLYQIARLATKTNKVFYVNIEHAKCIQNEKHFLQEYYQTENVSDEMTVQKCMQLFENEEVSNDEVILDLGGQKTASASYVYYEIHLFLSQEDIVFLIYL